MQREHDTQNIVKNLHIIFKQVNKTNLLSLSTYTKLVKTLTLQVSYTRENPYYFLPRLGLFERSKHNLQRLKIDMCLKYGCEETISRTLSNVTSFSDILRQCPNLHEIEIVNTPLYSFTSEAQYPSKLLSCNYVYLFEVLIYPSFLAMFSSHVSYIAEFTVSSCAFIGDLDNNIDMLDTTFDHIFFYDFATVRSVYLKLERTGSDSITRYVDWENHYGRYTFAQRLSHGTRYMPVFIRCKAVRTVTIKDTVNNFTITL